MTGRQPLSEQCLHDSLLQSRLDHFVACMKDFESAFSAFASSDKLFPVASTDYDLLPIHPSGLKKVERLAKTSLLAAKSLQLQFIALQRNNLQEEISVMEEELKTKSELIEKHERLIQRLRKEVIDQVGKHKTMLLRV